jgi:hypothetical protein
MKPLLNWQKSIYVDEDIGGSCQNVCEYCGGEKIFEKGDNDYGDNTHQYVTCSLCGWRGSREIIYKSDYYRKSYFSRSILMKFSQKKNEIVIDKLNIKVSLMENLIIYKLKNGYTAQINKFFDFVKSNQFGQLSDLKIDWELKKVTFNFDEKNFIFDFSTSMKILKFLELINYDLEKDHDFLIKYVIKKDDN